MNFSAATRGQFLSAKTFLPSMTTKLLKDALVIKLWDRMHQGGLILASYLS